MIDVMEVHVSVPDLDTARKMAAACLQQKLASCIQILGPVESLYVWEGKTEQAQEFLMLIKTTPSCYKSLENLITLQHPYDVPEILGFEAVTGWGPYADWVRDSVTPEKL